MLESARRVERQRIHRTIVRAHLFAEEPEGAVWTRQAIQALGSPVAAVQALACCAMLDYLGPSGGAPPAVAEEIAKVSAMLWALIDAAPIFRSE